MLGDFESVDRVLQDVKQFDWPPAARQAIAFTAGFAAELREHYGEALDFYEETISGLAAADFDEVYHIRALSGIVRLAAQRGEYEQQNSALRSSG